MSQDSLLGSLPLTASLENFLPDSPATQEVINDLMNNSQSDQFFQIETKQSVWSFNTEEGGKIESVVDVDTCELNLHEQTAGQMMENFYYPMEQANHPPIPENGIVPTTNNWLGEYNFNISFEKQPERTTKSTSWTYSELLDKLYVVHKKACPVKFQVDPNVPTGCYVRALPLFQKAEHLQETVRRCPNHSAPTDLSNIGFEAPEHLVRCDAPSAQYQQCHNGRLSVVVPYEQPQAGSMHTTYLYQFMCYNSCVGGLNRRPIQVIFTLEKDGEVLGRRKLPIRICACPGRDRKNDEKSREKHRSLSRQSSMTKSVVNEVVTVGPAAKRRRVDEEYTIKVHKLEHYQMLTKIKESLELADLVTPDVIAKYKGKNNLEDASRALAAMGTGYPRKVLKKKPRIS